MKKKVLFVSVVIMLIAMSVFMSAMPVLAGGHHRGRQTVQTVQNVRNLNYNVCTIEDCVITGLHNHNNITYDAHSYGDGHNYHEYCEIEDCVLAGYHLHGETYCFGHNLNDGHDYHDYCSVTNCKTTGYHEHSGVYCFGHNNNRNNGRGHCH